MRSEGAGLRPQRRAAMDDAGGDAAAKARVDLHKAKLEKMKALDEHLARLSLSTTELKASPSAPRLALSGQLASATARAQHFASRTAMYCC